MERLGEFPVKAPVAPGDIRAMLPAEAPEHGEDFTAVLADLDQVIVHRHHSLAGAGILRLFPGQCQCTLCVGRPGFLRPRRPRHVVGHQPCGDRVGAACALDWLADEMGLPEKFRGNGVIQDSASSSTLCAILAARHRAGGIGELSKMVAYTSEQAHSSIAKGLRVAGIADERVRSISTTPRLRHAGRPPGL